MAAEANNCTAEPRTHAFYPFTTCAIIAFLLLSCVLIRAVYNEYVLRHDDKFKKVKAMRLMYVIMVVLALIWSIVYLVVRTIDPFTFILRDKVRCSIGAWALYYIPIVFYGLYLYSVFLRLHTSFKGSVLALSRGTVYTLKTFLVIPTVTALVSYAVDDPDLPCVRVWDPPDFDSELSFCHIPYKTMILFQYRIFDGWLMCVNVLNITFGALMAVKLRKFVKMLQSTSSQNKDISAKQLKFQTLIFKGTTLVIVGCCSTTLGYLLYGLMEDDTFVVIDIFVNVLVIGLMFHWNRMYYKYLCAPCDMLCHTLCGHPGQGTSITPTLSLRRSNAVVEVSNRQSIRSVSSMTTGAQSLDFSAEITAGPVTECK